MIFNVLIGDLIVINIFIDLCQPGLQIARYLLAPRAHTQREQNQIYTPNADIYVAFRLQVTAGRWMGDAAGVVAGWWRGDDSVCELGDG